ncbi:MAG: hypothetical protein RI973_1023 [Bacteroidota bacterium]|jgi:predicted MFS family arabinose efflux permease
MITRAFSVYKDAFSGLPHSVWLLSTVTLINRSGTMVIPFLSIYLTTQKGFSLEDAGITLFLFGLGSLIGSFSGGYLTDKIGYFRVIFWSLLLGGFLFIATGYAEGTWGIWASVLALSIIGESFRPATMTAIGVYSQPENRTRSFSLMRMAINLGWSVGPAVGGLLISGVGYRALFWVDGLTCIFAAIFFALVLKPKEKQGEAGEAAAGQEKPAPVAVVSPYQDKPYLFFLLITTVSAIVFMQIISTLPVYFNREVHLTEAEIGALMALNGLLIVMLEMPVIFVMESRLGKVSSIGLGVLMYGVSYAILNLAPPGMLIAAVSMTVLSIGEIFNLPMANTYAMSRTTDANRGRYMGLFSMTWSVAHILGPAASFKVAEHLGFNALWYIVAGLSVAVYLGYWLLEKLDRPPGVR